MYAPKSLTEFRRVPACSSSTEKGSSPALSAAGLGQCCQCGWIVPGLEPTPGITDEVISILGAPGGGAGQSTHPHPVSSAPLLDPQQW